MTDLMVIDIGRQALLITLFLSGPLLIVSLVIGLIISIFQAATQINEMTLTFIPKLVATGVALVFTMPWMIKMFEQHFQYLMRMITPMLR